MFREDLKTLYTEIGVNNRKMVFLFTDAHVADEGFLELINNMLTSGMVPGLYADDEKEGIAGGVRDDCAKAGLGETKEACWRYYVDRCRNNLHIVLAMSPVGDTLRTRCRNFPGMVNNTVIDWFTPWPEDALRSVSEVFLRDLDMPDEFRETITEHMVLTHQSVRTTASSFTTSSAVTTTSRPRITSTSSPTTRRASPRSASSTPTTPTASTVVCRSS